MSFITLNFIKYKKLQQKTIQIKYLNNIKK